MIVSPVIDAVNDTTFWYTFIHKDIRGLMNWNMKFEWHDVIKFKKKKIAKFCAFQKKKKKI